MSFIIKRLSLVVSACAAAAFLTACETMPKAETAPTVQQNTPALENLQIGMTFDFPDCRVEVQGENTNVTPIDGQVCKFLYQEGEYEGYPVQSYIVLPGQGMKEGLSAKDDLAVDVIEGKVGRFTIVTGGLNEQERIYNELVKKLGEPASAVLVNEDIPNSPFAVNSVFVNWVVDGGRVQFIGNLKNQNVGLIIADSDLVIELQEKAQQQK